MLKGDAAFTKGQWHISFILLFYMKEISQYISIFKASEIPWNCNIKFQNLVYMYFGNSVDEYIQITKTREFITVFFFAW